MDSTVKLENAITNKSDKIAAALAKAQSEFKPLKKNKTAQMGTYSYQFADLADVIDSARAALTKNEIAVVQSVEREALETTLLHSSGQLIASYIPFQGSKSPRPQDMGAALTYARRYGFCVALGIVAEEDTDGHGPATQPEALKPKNSEATKSGGPTSTQITKLRAMVDAAGLSAQEVKERMKEKYGKNLSKELSHIELTDMYEWLDFKACEKQVDGH